MDFDWTLPSVFGFYTCNIAKHWIRCKLNLIEANTQAKPSKAENRAFLKKESPNLLFKS